MGILAFLFLLMSLDEYMSVHELFIEPIRETFSLRGIFYFAWIIPGLAGIIAAGFFFFRFLSSLPNLILIHFLLSAVVYFSGAMGLEIISDYFAYNQGQDNLLYALISTLEEVLEMLGISYFIFAILKYNLVYEARGYYIRLK